MDDRNYETFGRGEPVSLAALRRIKELAERSQRGFYDGGFTAVGAGGVTFTYPGPEQVGGIWLKITSQHSGSHALYGGVEVLNDAPEALAEPGGAVTVASDGATELLGNKSVPADGSAVVRAWPSATAEAGWAFVYGTGGGYTGTQTVVTSVSCSGSTLTVVTKSFAFAGGLLVSVT